MRKISITVACFFVVFGRSEVLAQSTDDCKDVLSIGRLDESSRSADSMDFVTASQFSEEQSGRTEENYAAGYGMYSGSAARSRANAAAMSQLQFSRLSRRQMHESRISRGDENAIRAWETCKGLRRGPSAILIARGATLELRLDWDQPNRIRENGATLNQPLHIEGAQIRGGLPCARVGYVITTGGCILSLARIGNGAVSVTANTDFGAISAYAPPNRNIRFVRIPYPANYPGHGEPAWANASQSAPPLSASGSIGHTGRDNGGTNVQNIVVVMNPALVRAGWVFDVSESAGEVVTGRGHAGRCNQLSNVIAWRHRITATVSVRTFRGDTGYVCDVSFSPGIVRAE